MYTTTLHPLVILVLKLSHIWTMEAFSGSLDSTEDNLTGLAAYVLTGMSSQKKRKRHRRQHSPNQRGAKWHGTFGHLSVTLENDEWSSSSSLEISEEQSIEGLGGYWSVQHDISIFSTLRVINNSRWLDPLTHDITGICKARYKWFLTNKKIKGPNYRNSLQITVHLCLGLRLV